MSMLLKLFSSKFFFSSQTLSNSLSSRVQECDIILCTEVQALTYCVRTLKFMFHVMHVPLLYCIEIKVMMRSLATSCMWHCAIIQGVGADGEFLPDNHGFDYYLVSINCTCAWQWKSSICLSIIIKCTRQLLKKEMTW